MQRKKVKARRKQRPLRRTTRRSIISRLRPPPKERTRSEAVKMMMVRVHQHSRRLIPSQQSPPKPHDTQVLHLWLFLVPSRRYGGISLCFMNRRTVASLHVCSLADLAIAWIYCVHRYASGHRTKIRLANNLLFIS